MTVATVAFALGLPSLPRTSSAEFDEVAAGTATPAGAACLIGKLNERFFVAIHPNCQEFPHGSAVK
jgi:hypothetical protein